MMLTEYQSLSFYLLKNACGYTSKAPVSATFFHEKKKFTFPSGHYTTDHLYIFSCAQLTNADYVYTYSLLTKKLITLIIDYAQ